MKIFKSRLFIFLITAISFLSIGVFADSLLSANDILYAPSNSEFDVTTVNEALDKLYGMTKETIYDFTYTKEVTVNSIVININTNENFFDYYCAIGGTKVVNGDSGKCILDTLEPGTDYEVLVAGIDKDGNINKKKEIVHTIDIEYVKVYNLSNECAKKGNTCTSSLISAGVSMDVAVKGGDNPLVYRYHVLSDNGEKMVLVKDTPLLSSVWGTNGTPKAMIDNVRNISSEWNGLLTIEYTMNSTEYALANTCDSNWRCTKGYTYPDESIVALSRPARAQELQSYISTSWMKTLYGNYGYSWTLTHRGDSPYMLINYSVSTSFNAGSSFNVVTVIEINKKYIDFVTE